MAGKVGKEEENIEGVVKGEEKVLFLCQPCGLEGSSSRKVKMVASPVMAAQAWPNS